MQPCIHISQKLKITAACFAVSFLLVMYLFIKKPHIVKSKNRAVRAVMAFALAFIPGVLAASVFATTLTAAYDRFFRPDEQTISDEFEDEEEEEDEDEEEKDDE
ncbi:MAG: hypothetical protein J5501_05030 [Ruminococcus sp.]|nr:hypothetical protein [Ruminococcus sp.]